MYLALIDGDLVRYDDCFEKTPDLNKYHYLGDGIVHSIGGVKQTGRYSTII